MKMTAAYLDETAAWFEARGFHKKTEEDELAPDDRGRVARVCRHVLSRDDLELALEWVVHPDAPERYFLEIVGCGPLSSPLYPLDSWKHREGRVEFKYGVDPVSGLGHTFVVEATLDDGQLPSQSL